MPAAALNPEGRPSFDICQGGSWEFLRYSDPSEKNHWNHHLLWNSFAPSPLMPQTNPPHILWTSILAYVQYVCVWMCLIVGVRVWLCEHMHICFSVCDPHMPPGWSQRLGYVAYCISSWGGSWGCCAEALRRRAWFTVRRGPDVTGSVFWKTSSRPGGRQQPPQPRLTAHFPHLPPKSPNPNH